MTTYRWARRTRRPGWREGKRQREREKDQRESEKRNKSLPNDNISMGMPYLAPRMEIGKETERKGKRTEREREEKLEFT